MTELATLTVAELDCLADCEQRIERGLKTFVEVGTSLATIRDNRLYRAEFGTFEDYCQDRWGFDRTRAQNFITAARTVLEISNTGLPTPERESQARELARVPEPERADIWRETVERTDGKPTAAAIRETYERTQTPAATPEPEPEGSWPPVATPPVDPHAEEDARRDAELDAVLSETATRFRVNFSSARLRAAEITTFDPERVCEVYAANFDREVGDLLNRLQQWSEQVREAQRARQRAGLRLVIGGDQ